MDRLITGICVVLIAIAGICCPLFAQTTIEEWNNRNTQVVEYYSQGNMEQAMQLGVEVLQEAKKLFGPTHQHVATALNNLAAIYELVGMKEEALDAYSQALGIFVDIFGEEHLFVATTLNNIAGLYDKKGKIELAEKNYLKALDIYISLKNEDHPDILILIKNIAIFYDSVGNASESLHYYTILYDKEVALSGDNSKTLIPYWKRFIDLYAKLGDYEKASEYYNNLLALSDEDIVASNDSTLHLKKLADYYHNKGDLEKAKELYEKYVAMHNEDSLEKAEALWALAENEYAQENFNKVLPMYHTILENLNNANVVEHALIPKTYKRIATINSVQNNFDQALEAYVQAFNAQKAMSGKYNEELIDILNNIVRIYYDQQEYALAEPYSEYLLSMNNLKKSNEVLDDLIRHAHILYNQEKTASALKFYNRVIHRFEKDDNYQHPEAATCYFNLATIYFAAGSFEKAAPMLEQTIMLNGNLTGAQGANSLDALYKLASIYYKQKQYYAASKIYEQTLNIHQQQYGRNHLTVAQDLNNLALLSKKQHQFNKAESFYQEALAIKKTILGTDHPSVAISLNNLASLYLQQRKFMKAGIFYDNALTILEKNPENNKKRILAVLQNMSKFYWELGEDFKVEKIKKRIYRLSRK